jgi:hypothetical protein
MRASLALGVRAHTDCGMRIAGLRRSPAQWVFTWSVPGRSDSRRACVDGIQHYPRIRPAHAWVPSKSLHGVARSVSQGLCSTLSACAFRKAVWAQGAGVSLSLLAHSSVS